VKDRRSAAEKVAKLRRLADDPRTPPTEAQAARNQADKIARENGLGDQDLIAGRMGAAFDDLVEEIGKVVARHPNIPTGLFGTSSVIRDALNQVRAMQEADKVNRLRQIVSVVRAASFFLSDNRMVAEVKIVVDTALKNHNIVI
jgi:hypothetical protein